MVAPFIISNVLIKVFVYMNSFISSFWSSRHVTPRSDIWELQALIEKSQKMITSCHEFLNVESNNTISYMMQESSVFDNNLNISAIQDYSKLTEKRFKCAYCSKSFNQKIHLMKHIRIHTGEKPFVCSICSTAFRQKEHLKNHMLVHMKNSLNPPTMHNCTHCSINFRNAYFLQRHVLKFHGENT